MAKRKSLSTRERVRLFTLHEGVCHICEHKIDGVRERWEIEHVIPWELTRDDSDENRKPAHYDCHKGKTPNDIRMIRKSDRVMAKHIGAKKRTGRGLPGNRDGQWKQKIGGGLVRRDEK